MPAGRKKIEAYWLKEESLHPVLRRMEKELVAGRQAYVICPLIEEYDKLDVQNERWERVYAIDDGNGRWLRVSGERLGA